MQDLLYKGHLYIKVNTFWPKVTIIEGFTATDVISLGDNLSDSRRVTHCVSHMYLVLLTIRVGQSIYIKLKSCPSVCPSRR